MKQDSIVGIDLAKNTFSVCVMSSAGRVVVRKQLSRGQLFEWVICHSDGVIAMEACGGAHYWARRFEGASRGVRILPGQFVKPFVKSNKNDDIDAEAICEAAWRPQMRFVATRSEEQQDLQSLHRIRERHVRQRTALANEIRGLLLEYGIVLSKGISHIRRDLPRIMEGHGVQHSQTWRAIFGELYEEFCGLDRRVDEHDQRLAAIAKSDEVCQRLLKIPGVGELSSTAIVAAVGNAKEFTNGRQFAAWLGLTPKQYTTGGKMRLGGISKRGDRYLRKLLVQGALSAAIAAERRRNHKDPLRRQLNKTQQWLFKVAERRGTRRAVVALANKTARRIWVVLSGQEFRQPEELLPAAA